ncbi:MAG: hypothetical protein HQK62_09025 [Desulfamplus sp.]|nr:hypothetical protein [Desulfamplus sp.]MBF0258965.1 hypothetical protein [Desulfamplus sp.]
MTTIPGAHTHVIQQSNTAHDATHHLKPVQPDPGHLQNQQVTREAIEQTTVISSDPSGKVNVDARAKKREEQKKAAEQKRKKNMKKVERDPDLPGNLVNTVA